jgi:fibronectin-binding autotransporter adhesin
MANRYWVGGTADWDGTAGTKWATTSGGAGGASVPTTADAVFFTNLSTGTCTIATGNTGALSINCTGFTGTIAGSAAITVAGSVTLVAGMTYTYTGTVTFTGTGTLITAGKTFSGVTINGSGITVTLGDALNAANGNLTVTQGTFNTANYSVTANQIDSSGTSARTISLGSSTLSFTNSVNFNVSTNLTLNAGTSQINISSSFGALTSGGLTFYNVSFTSTAAQVRTISGANTFNNLTLIASASGLSELSLGGNQTVSGTLTCAGTSVTQRGFVRSDTIGTSRTITAAAISANDCDFRDITIAGAAAGSSPTRAGDCGGNSGITFPAAKTVYRVGTDTTWAGSSSWALTSGAAGSNNNFPLAQDTAVIDNATTLTGTLALAVYNIGGLNCSTRTTGITLNHNATVSRYGSYILGSGVTVSGTSSQTFSGRSTMVFTSAGKTMPFSITVDAPSGTFRLGDALVTNLTITHTRGTFDALIYNVTTTLFLSNNSNTRTLMMGSGLWTLSDSGTGSFSPWTLSATGLTFDKGTANILFSSTTVSARTFQGAGLSYNKFTLGGATGSSTTTITGTNSFTELASIKTVAHTVNFAADQGTIDTWSITGTVGNVVTVNSSAGGTRRTFNLTNVATGIDYLSVTDIGVNQTNRFYVGANSTNGGNNSNVIFTAAPAGITIPSGLTITGGITFSA